MLKLDELIVFETILKWNNKEVLAGAGMTGQCRNTLSHTLVSPKDAENCTVTSNYHFKNTKVDCKLNVFF